MYSAASSPRVRHGYKLGQKQAFFYKLVPDLVKAMGDAYPELKEKQTQIMEALRAEESRFGETLEKVWVCSTKCSTA